jgi:hypothetical protein
MSGHGLVVQLERGLMRTFRIVWIEPISVQYFCILSSIIFVSNVFLFARLCMTFVSPFKGFEHMHGHQFWAIPSATATLQTKQFVILSSYAFICLLSSSPKIRPTGLELGQEDAE